MRMRSSISTLYSSVTEYTTLLYSQLLRKNEFPRLNEFPTSFYDIAYDNVSDVVSNVICDVISDVVSNVGIFNRVNYSSDSTPSFFELQCFVNDQRN